MYIIQRLKSRPCFFFSCKFFIKIIEILSFPPFEKMLKN